MPDCPECGMSYTSPLAAAECADMDRAEESRLQRALRGVRGPVTRKALQSFLKAKGYYRGPIDGDLGQASTKALQTYLNNQAQYYK